FSSCSGRAALTKACIHCGASPARTGTDKAQKESARAAKAAPRFLFSIPGRDTNRLQDNLLFIGIFHQLIEITERGIVFWLEISQFNFDLPFQMQRTVLVFRLQVINNRLSVLNYRFWKGAHLPAERKLDLNIILLLIHVTKIEGVDSSGMLVHMFLRSAE